MCPRVICTMSVGRGEWMGSIMALATKGGRVVVTNVHPWTETEETLSMIDVMSMEKELVGSIFGSSNPEEDVPRLLGLYRDGLLDLDAMVARTYPLEGINDGYQDLRDGLRQQRGKCFRAWQSRTRGPPNKLTNSALTIVTPGHPATRPPGHSGRRRRPSSRWAVGRRRASAERGTRAACASPGGLWSPA